MTKILFTDLDGTLLLSTSKISPSMKEALTAMIAAGHTLVLSSGRPLNSIISVKEEAGLDFPGIYIIANNGATIYNCDTKEIIAEKRLALEDVDYLLNAAANRNLHMQTYSDTHIISRFETDELKGYHKKIKLPYIVHENPISQLEKGPFKALAIDLDSKSNLEDFKSSLLTYLDNRITAIFSNDRYLEFFSSTAGKGNALVELCDILNIPVANSIAAGDAENDLSMLQAAGTSIAMMNGDHSLKEIADIITTEDNNHDGLIPVITQYFLNN
ncbi:MAG: Cof-type HAD-IIB family hydrolase [Eubacteriales bacterium]